MSTESKSKETVMKLTKVDDPAYPYQDSYGVSFSSPEEYLWTEVLGGCGCGRSEFNEALLAEVLRYFGAPHEERDLEFTSRPEVEILAHWMDSVGLLEHGGSVGGAWLSDDGKTALSLLNNNPHEALPSRGGSDE